MGNIMARTFMLSAGLFMIAGGIINAENDPEGNAQMVVFGVFILWAAIALD